MKPASPQEHTKRAEHTKAPLMSRIEFKIGSVFGKIWSGFVAILSRWMGQWKKLLTEIAGKTLVLLKFKEHPFLYKAGCVILCLTLSYMGVLLASKKLNFYGLELVKIVGVDRLHPYEILEELDLQKGTSMLTLNTVTLEQQLRTRPQIKHVQIHKQYPNTLKIVIEEKAVYFLVKTPQELYAVSQYGEILFRGNRIHNHDRFIIEIETELNDENFLTHKELLEFLTYFKHLADDEKDLIRLFSGIYFGKEILMFAKDERVTFNLGRELSLHQLRKARYAYLYKKQKNIQKSLVDLRFNFVRYTS